MRQRLLLSIAMLIYLACCLPSLVNGQPPVTRPGAGNSPTQQPELDDVPQAAQQQDVVVQDWPKTRQAGDRAEAAQAPVQGAPGQAQQRMQVQPKVQAEAKPTVRIDPGIAPPSRNWFLGITAERGPRGIRVSSVVYNSPAQQFGLEEGDYILDVGGYVVGEYQGSFYPLPLAMDFGTDPNSGWAEFLVWNKRTFREETLWIRLNRRAAYPIR